MAEEHAISLLPPATELAVGCAGQSSQPDAIGVTSMPRIVQLVGFLLALGVIRAVGAQQTDNAAGSSVSGTLAEIVVTAEKRMSTVQDTPISITAVSGAELEARGLSSLLSVAQATPGVSFKTAGPGQTEFEMRGLSSTGGFSPTVGFYLDDAPVTAPAQAFQGKVVIDPDLYDLNRVEILRGPQGTLYGSGSMGGTIKLISNQPVLNQLHASAEIVGSDTAHGGGNGTGNAMLNIPLVSDVAALRVIGTYKHDDGWIDRIVLNPFPLETSGGLTRGDVLTAPVQKVVPDVNWEQLVGGRAKLLIQIGDRLTFTPEVLYQRITQGGENTIDNPPGTVLAHFQPFDTAEPFSDAFTLYTGTISYDMSAFRIDSVTSRWYRSEAQNQDIAESLQVLFGLPGYSVADGGVGGGPITETDTTSQFSEEIRLTSNGHSAFQWLLGGFYSNFHSDTGFYSLYPGIVGLFGTDVLSVIDQPISIRQKAVFANASYKITPRLKATVGLRWYTYDSASATTVSGIATQAAGPGIYSASAGASDSGSNPMVNLSYTFPHGTLVYATAAKGYRPGSGNLPVPLSGPIQCLTGAGNLQSLGLTSAPKSFNPDTLWSYEFGEKYMSPERRLSLNSSVYYEKWRDIQQQVALSCGFLFTANAGSAGIYGTEVELSAVLMPRLTFVQNFGYTHATLADTVLETGTVAGEQILDVPKVTSSSSLMYSQPVSDSYALTMSVTNEYVGSMQDITFTRNDVPGYDLLGARLGVQSSNWSAYAFVDNLTNRMAELTNINALSANVPQFNRVAVARPRTIGVDLQYRY